jgi:hypothetical protein
LHRQPFSSGSRSHLTPTSPRSLDQLVTLVADSRRRLRQAAFIRSPSTPSTVPSLSSRARPAWHPQRPEDVARALAEREASPARPRVVAHDVARIAYPHESETRRPAARRQRQNPSNLTGEPWPPSNSSRLQLPRSLGPKLSFVWRPESLVPTPQSLVTGGGSCCRSDCLPTDHALLIH